MRTIQVMGMGCQKCRVLEERTRQAVQASGIEATIEKVADPAVFVRLGVMSTPALVVDGVVMVAGRVPTVAAIRDLIG
ncbi:MAG: thioredoxin family protein [Vicinamibacterales bacterium]